MKDLGLYNAQLGDGGAVALAEALKVNSSMKELDLHSNQIGVSTAVLTRFYGQNTIQKQNRAPSWGLKKTQKYFIRNNSLFLLA